MPWLKRTVLGVVAAALLVPVAPAAAQLPSTTCDTYWINGHLIGSEPVRLGTTGPSSYPILEVCFRVGNVEGGKVTVWNTTGLPGVPSIDTNGDACTSGTGWPAWWDLTVAGQRTLFATYSPNGRDLWICAMAGAVRYRVILPGSPTGGSPSVNYERDYDL